MSRGLSQQQRVILGILRGSEPTQVYASGRGGLITSELTLELEERELLPPGAPWRQQLFTVRRACHALLRRGLLTGSYDVDDKSGARTITWKAADE